ncbi:MAG: PQQ-like beta-propeller repeat protein [Opitutae bacterium]|nr:PQQ-like beta-propeller repeat protein [Opitutae bacterium]
MKLLTLTVPAALGCMVFLSSCVKIEWRGGMTPSFKWKSKKDESRLLSPNPQAGEFRLNDNSTTANWPDFRGPGRRGIAPEQGVDLDWEEDLIPVWRKPIGQGHSSVIITGNHLYTTEQEGDFEVLSCTSLMNGSIIWNYRSEDRWYDSMGGLGPRSTPVFSNGKIFSLSSSGKLACLDAVTGELEWKQSTLETDYKYPHWGISCSPLVLDDLIIVSTGGKAGAAKAYDSTTGEPRWTSELKGAGVYLSPAVLELHGEKYLIAAVEGKLAGLDPTNGKTLWEHPWKIFMVNALIVQPLELSEDVFLLSAGYGKGAEAIRLKKTADSFETEQIWKSKNLKTKFSSPVLRNGYLYGLSESSLTCLDASTGELKWRGKKYGYGRVLLAKDKLLILGNTGILSVIEANPEAFEEIASHQVLSKERCWNGPALVRGYLVVRNGSEIACYDFAKR